MFNSVVTRVYIASLIVGKGVFITIIVVIIVVIIIIVIIIIIAYFLLISL